MTDVLRILLLLVLAGAVLTGVAAWLGWWNEETRRLTRVIRNALGGPADALIIAHGRNAAAAFRMDTEQVLVLRNGGANALLYPMAALLGAELIADGAVAARVHRGEPRRALEKARPPEEDLFLRLLFDNPRDPDFELDLGPEAIGEARTWMARAEAITRWPGRQPNVGPAVKTAEPHRELQTTLDDDEDEDDPPF